MQVRRRWTGWMSVIGLVGCLEARKAEAPDTATAEYVDCGDGLLATTESACPEPDPAPEADPERCTGAGAGADLHVPAEYPTIAEAIEAARDGDRICLASGTYEESVHIDGQQITIVGMGATTQLRGTGHQPALTVSGPLSTLDLEHLTLRGSGKRDCDGGAGLRAEDADVVLTDVSVRDFEMTCDDDDLVWGSTGAGIYIRGGSLRLTDTEVVDNAQWGHKGRGAGIALFDTNAWFERVRVQGNVSWSTDALGAGVYAESTRLEVSDSVFSGNELHGAPGASLVAGAALFAMDSTVELHHTDVSDNHIRSSEADLAGGAGLRLQDCDVRLDDVLLQDNTVVLSGLGTAHVYGGVIAASIHTRGSLALTNVELLNNTANVGTSGSIVSILGLGIYVEGDTSPRATVALDHVRFDNNAAWASAIDVGSIHGLGLYVEGVDVEGRHIVAVDNVADARLAVSGGLIGGHTTHVDLDNVIVAGNRMDAPTVAEGLVAAIGALPSSAAPGDGLWLSHADVYNNVIGAQLGDAGLVSAGGSGHVHLSHSNIEAPRTSPVTDWNAAIVAVEGGPDHLQLDHVNVWNLDGIHRAFSVENEGVEVDTMAFDPLYTDTTSDFARDWDLRLQSTSPAIDAGDPTCTDPDGSTCDLGAFGGPLGSW